MGERRMDIPERLERDPEGLAAYRHGFHVWADEDGNTVLSFWPPPERLWRGGQGQTRPAAPGEGR
jgi:hypothetical protein